ncbi:MAG: YceI family protein [Bacteroidota bacterium]
MVTIVGLFTLFAGILATIAYARNSYYSIKSISYFILSLAILILSMDHFSYSSHGQVMLPTVLISIISVHFFLGEITKKKSGVWWNLIPLLSTLTLLFLPQLEDVSYMGFGIDGTIDVFLIALVAASIPFLTHLAKLGISNLIIRFGTIKWAEHEENYLESLVSYAFIGGIAVFGSFLLGNLGLLLAGTFHLSATLIARNKVGLQNDILSAASGALFLLIFIPIYLEMGSFDQLDFTRGEVLEGAFVAGFMILFHELFMKLARYNTGKWKVILTFFALFVPLLAVVLLGFAYTQLERLGGVLTLGGMVASIALLSVVFTIFKNSSLIALKLITIGAALLILPSIKPVESTSKIDYAALGIEKDDEASKSSDSSEEDGDSDESEDAPAGKDIMKAQGKWSINEDQSQITFALGPPDGRTEGAIQSISGEVVVADELNKSELSVVMKVASLTTHNSMRDESLMSDDYFHEEQYPEMTYEAKSFKKDGDTYLLDGTFTMLGTSNPLEVELKLVGTGESDGKKVAILWGKSQLDRTTYGMDPSEKLGNVVDFNFEVQLDKK